MLYLDLRVVEQGLKLVEGGCPGISEQPLSTPVQVRTELDCAMEILTDASFKYEDLTKIQVDVIGLFDLALELKTTIVRINRALACQEAKEYTFGNLESELDFPSGFRCPVLKVNIASEEKRPDSCDDVRERTVKNIGLVSLFRSDGDFEWADLLRWMNSPDLHPGTSVEHSWLILRYKL